LDLPDLRFVIGELGQHGLNYETRLNADGYTDASARVKRMSAAQKGVTQMPEFYNNTLFVRTAPYAVLDGETYSGHYHYSGRADTILKIGREFANGMLHMMMKDNQEEINENSTR